MLRLLRLASQVLRVGGSTTDKGASVEVLWLPGGNAAWQAAGFSTQQGESYLASPRIDHYRRPYEGSDNLGLAMQAYLDWQHGLVEQLQRDGTHHFKVI